LEERGGREGGRGEERKSEPREEAGSNISTEALPFVEGDEKRTQCLGV
jgi:hypothetical protein